MTALAPQGFTVAARRTGSVTVRARFTRYWAPTRGAACVERAPGGWTRLRVLRPGEVRVAIRFSPGRLWAGGPRCRRPARAS